MMETPLGHRPRTAVTSVVIRLLAGLLCGWLFMVPQVMFSSAVVDFCDEYGTGTLPLIEEEEVHQSGIPPRTFPSSCQASCDLDAAELPHWEELLLHTLHGEVPHPPPWA